MTGADLIDDLAVVILPAQRAARSGTGFHRFISGRTSASNSSRRRASPDLRLAVVGPPFPRGHRCAMPRWAAPRSESFSGRRTTLTKTERLAGPGHARRVPRGTISLAVSWTKLCQVPRGACGTVAAQRRTYDIDESKSRLRYRVATRHPIAYLGDRLFDFPLLTFRDASSTPAIPLNCPDESSSAVWTAR